MRCLKHHCDKTYLFDEHRYSCKKCDRKGHLMSEELSIFLGWVAGLLVLGAMTTGIVLWGNSEYGDLVKAHYKQWPVHQGTIISQGKQVVNPYGSRAGFSVEFPNFYNQLRTVSVYGYPRPLGSQVPVRVNRDGGAIVSGAIYPYMKDESLPNPLYTPQDFFPVASDTIFIILACLISIIVGIATFAWCDALPVKDRSLRGRLGVHS